ncbi:hypothetical protein FQR65_LT19799 [Abscondita terminalis]|nr:hypothetical protein FQR65_LT19799 [Abscondita terminalis]
MLQSDLLAEFRAGQEPAGFWVNEKSNAGCGSNFWINIICEQGALIVLASEEVYKADLIIKVASPTLEEVSLMKTGQVLFSSQQPSMMDLAVLQSLIKKKVTALSYEYLQDEGCHLTVVRAMSEIEGLTCRTYSRQSILVYVFDGRDLCLEELPVSAYRNGYFEQVTVVNDYSIFRVDGDSFLSTPLYNGFMKDGNDDKLIDTKTAALILFYNEISENSKNIEKKTYSVFLNQFDKEVQNITSKSTLKKAGIPFFTRGCGMNHAIKFGFSASSAELSLKSELRETSFMKDVLL